MSGIAYSPPRVGTLTVGSVTTLAPGAAASVTNTGTPQDAVLTFGIPAGAPGSTPQLSIGTVTTLASGAPATASITADGVISLGIPRGAAGANASATPLGTATPQALGTATPGSSVNASREDHVHPLPSGRCVFVGNITVQKTLLLALSSGMQREDFALAGITTADQGKLFFAAITPCSAGCEAINVYAKSANIVTLSYNTPALAVGAVINIPLAIYRIVA